MDANSKTLYIPLYGKAAVSRRGILLRDERAEQIWGDEGFVLRGKSKSRWLALYMGMRAAVFDDWLRERLREKPTALVLHLGCGLDSRCERVREPRAVWYDVDLPEVIVTRRRYFADGEGYTMLGGDAARPEEWLSGIPRAKDALVVTEGLSMYLERAALERLFAALQAHFESAALITDVYTTLAARLSLRSNPIKDVGARLVYGIDDPRELEINGGVKFTGELSMTPESKIDELVCLERGVFKAVYAGGMSKGLYRLYTYELKEGGNE